MKMRMAVLVACYNRYQVTLANLQKLVDALNDTDVEYKIHLLDDASPDETGRRVRERFPNIHVINGSGDLFWSRGMHVAFSEAVKQGPYDAYLLFNDDVSVARSSVHEFIELYRRLNLQSPTALAAATMAHDSERITYTGIRLASRHRPLSTVLVPPQATAVPIDTFNGNFVMIPGRSMEEIGGTDPYYWHQFGDIDLGLSMLARGERVFLAPTPIGRCDDNGDSVPSRHGLVTRFRMGLTGHGDPRQRAYLIRKHSPTKIGATVAVTAMFVRRLWVLATNKPHVAKGSDAAAEIRIRNSGSVLR